MNIIFPLWHVPWGKSRKAQASSYTKSEITKTVDAWSTHQLDHHLTQRLLWFLPEQLQKTAYKSSGCIPMTLLSTVRMCDACGWI